MSNLDGFAGPRLWAYTSLVERTIREFIEVLRNNGIRVSISENLEALRALAEVGLESREDFRTTLRATLIKSSRDLQAFEDLFEIFFSGLGNLLRQDQEQLLARFASPQAFQEFLEKLAQFLQEHGLELSELSLAILFRDTGRLEELIRQAAEAAGLDRIKNLLQEGFYTRNVLTQMGFSGMQGEFERLLDLLRARENPTEFESLLRSYLEFLAAAFPALVREFVRQEREKRAYGERDRLRAESLADRNFNYLTREEIVRMQDEVKRLAERLKQVTVIRKKEARRGTFDVKRTFRRNLQYGGVPIEIVLQRKKKEKPELILLCDVSDSVRTASRFMLQFVYSVQELFDKVRSFIFVSDIGEVTGLFKELEINAAIEEALGNRVINLFSHSNFGHAFACFHRDHLDAVNSRTTVIIMGDGRNNYADAKDWTLRDLRARAKHLYWMNPEGKPSWGFGDSEMKVYARHCDSVEEVMNLRQLARFIDKLVT